MRLLVLFLACALATEQPRSSLCTACFTGDYPTPGGARVVNTAYLKWRRNDQSRSY